MCYESVPSNNTMSYYFTNLFIQFNSNCICLFDVDCIRPQLVLQNHRQTRQHQTVADKVGDSRQQFTVVLNILATKQFCRQSWLVSNSVHTADTNKTRRDSLVLLVVWTRHNKIFASNAQAAGHVCKLAHDSHQLESRLGEQPTTA